MANIVAAIDYNKSGEKYTEMQQNINKGHTDFLDNLSANGYFIHTH